MERDREVTRRLEAEGWTVLRFWGNDIKKRLVYCGNVVEDVLIIKST